MQDRPTAAELLEAAREFCERDLMPSLEGRKRFHTRVLIGVLGILERELAGEEEAVRREWDLVSELLGGDEEPPAGFATLRQRLRELNAELAASIRSGALDDRAEEVRDTLQQIVDAKLRIANPGYAEEG